MMKLKTALEWVLIAILVAGSIYLLSMPTPILADSYDCCGGQQYYWSDVQNPPQFSTRPNRGYDRGPEPNRDRGYGYDSQQYYWSDVGNQPQFSTYPGR